LVAFQQLVLIWATVFAAVVSARKTRLTPVLYYLFAGFVLNVSVSIGINLWKRRYALAPSL
jgi:Kef-type K+ transport system membrane component KefB